MTGSKFISVMDKIGHDLEVAWADVVKYMPEAASLAAVLFPAQVATIGGVVNSVSLIQQAVATVEQKFAAMGKATGTGTQKLAQVTSMVGPVVTQLLAAEGLSYDQTRINNIISAVVAVLNVQEVPAT